MVCWSISCRGQLKLAVQLATNLQLSCKLVASWTANFSFLLLQMVQQTILQRLYCHGNKLDSHCVIPKATPGSDFDYAQEGPVAILLAVLLPNLSPAYALATALCSSHDPIRQFLCGHLICRQQCTNCAQGHICHGLCAQRSISSIYDRKWDYYGLLRGICY